MSVARNESLVKADITRHPRWNDLQLSTEQIVLADLVRLLEIFDETRLRLRVLAVRKRCPTDGIEVFRREKLVAFLLRLVLAEMRQNVGNHEDGIAVVVADGDENLRAVLADNRPVQRERQREPLVLLDSAVHVAVEVDAPALLVERFRLKIEPRRVRMAADDLETSLGDFPFADDSRHHRPVLIASIDLVSGLQRLKGRNFSETLRLQETDALRIAAARRLGDAQIAHVFFAVLLL